MSDDQAIQKEVDQNYQAFKESLPELMACDPIRTSEISTVIRYGVLRLIPQPCAAVSLKLHDCL